MLLPSNLAPPLHPGPQLPELRQDHLRPRGPPALLLLPAPATLAAPGAGDDPRAARRARKREDART
ncbi:C2HC5 zinc finger domain-containing protein [Histoplasma capsulatum var. duboisii H88]|uniref:C2HC5 zinc finger domain-containing protein n=1 Tax=Ajellomyces capsulatus (strain H88) TaxID=544711 RepID=A0A8A1LQ00_AJEC8|nr:C2HC5 zinc finger domain-containing protein [Histoplasma capsulatum var. duboisii H88]